MNLDEVVLCCIAMLLSMARQVICKNTYDIPVAFNPLIQDSVTIGSTEKLFYDMDKDFYSKVTVIDAANNAEQRVKDTIRKAINVVFLTVASSHVSGTLTDGNLLYPTKSNWSYTVDVNSILAASKGELSTINDKTRIDKIQENAMKVLEVRFGFEKTEILNRLKLELQDYYAVDEAMWIRVVGIIVEKVIASRSALLNLTTCYLADMLDKKAEQIQGFTLNEVDTYIYNTAMLLQKVPQYRENVIARLYDTFQLTSTDLSRISNTDLSEINTMILHDVLQLFTSSVLNKLRVTANEITQKDSSFDSEMLLSCTNKWRPFLTIIIPESFDNSAEAMAIEVDKLSALVNISYSEIQQYTITEMITLLEMIIDPLSAQKTLVEATTLSRVLQRHSSDKLDTKKDNVFQVIYRFTNFTERQLTTLYRWTSQDYIFSSMFTLEEANDVCSLNLMDYDLLALAKLTVGQIGDIICQSFNVLREIWERKTIKFLEDEFSSEKLALDIPISLMVSQLTKASSTINYRVLNISSEAEELISDLSINNITMVTTYRSSYLKTLSFQDVIGIVLHLKHNGSFDHQVTTRTENTMLTNVEASTPIITSLLSTTKITIPKQMTSPNTPSTKTEILSIVEASSTMKVFAATTEILTQEPPTEKPSTPTTTTIRAVVKPSSNRNLVTLSMIGKHSKTSSSYFSTTILPTPPILSQSTTVSNSSLPTRLTPFVARSTTKSEATSSSIQKPAITCQPTCNANEVCNLSGLSATCEAAINLEGNIRITSGVNFIVDLEDITSEAFRRLAFQIEKTIDFVYQNSNFSAFYLGCQVLRFKRGSVIASYKLSFNNNLDLSDNTVENIAQVLKNAQNTNFTIDNNSINITDFDECSSGLPTKCDKAATCNNTLGSYSCICPKGMIGDGTSCQVVNSRESDDKEDVPWIIYVVIAIMVVLIIFLIVVIIYCEKRHKKKYRPQALDFNNGGINMYPRSTSYLAQTPESEADLADGLGIVNRHEPQLNMVTFNPTPEDKKELQLQNGQPGVFQYRL